MTRRAVLAGLPSLGVAAQLGRKVRVALIGLDGHPGEVSGPIPKLADTELVAVHDPDPKSMARHPKSRPYADWRQMVDREKPDVVGVCNANSLHAGAIVECLGRGIHVIAEKPIATDGEDLERVRAAVERATARFTSILPMRLSPPYLKLAELVRAGEVGEVLQIDCQKSYKVSKRPAWFFKRETYGGTMAWIGIHMIDLMLAISGRDFTEAFGYQAHIGFDETGDTENVTGTVFRLDNGGVALLRMDYLRPQKARTHGDDRLRVAGSKGVAEYMEATGVTLVSESRDRTVFTDLPPARSVFVEFLEHIYLGKPAPIPWKQIHRGHVVALRAREAMETRKVVKL